MKSNQTPPMAFNQTPTNGAKTNMTKDEIMQFLFGLLDDIDTADDIAKGNDKLYRNLVRRAHSRRFEVASTDGYTVTFNVKEIPSE